MGNRSYLYVDKGEHNLFEANNSLPFFWIGLLDKSILDKHKPAWEQYDELLETGNEAAIDELLSDVPSPLDFAISHEAFERNSTRTGQFLQRHYSHLLPLYDDFVRYVTAQFQADDHIILSTLEMANFYSRNKDFLETLYKEIDAIEQDKPSEIRYLFNDDLIASGTGFSLSDSFPKTSVAYQQAMAARDATPTKRVSNHAPPSKKSAPAFWIILLLCPVFTYIVYRGYSKDGFSAMVIIIAICNIGFYWFSISQLMAIAKNRKKEKAIG